MIRCPTCADPYAEVLFQSTQCLNKNCKNYCRDYEEDFYKHLKSKKPLTTEEIDEIDEDLDNAFQMTFGWTGTP